MNRGSSFQFSDFKSKSFEDNKTHCSTWEARQLIVHLFEDGMQMINLQIPQVTNRMLSKLLKYMGPSVRDNVSG